MFPFDDIIMQQMASNAENVSNWWRHHVLFTIIWILSNPSNMDHGRPRGIINDTIYK